MKKDLTELAFILDKSGSMAGLESDTIANQSLEVDPQGLETGVDADYKNRKGK